VNGQLVRSDAELRSVIERARRANEPIPPVGLLGGDLCRTLGGPGSEARLRSGEATTFSVDVASALVDGRLHWFAAHLVARRSWWRGRVLAVMNAQFIGSWDVAPRSHPGDGRLDVVDADPTLADRWKARRRLATGSHVPHPRIAVRATDAWQTDLTPPLDVWLDGVKVGRARHLSVRVEPDALTVVV
jgi:diacylglycerol kinase family enzyme